MTAAAGVEVGPDGLMRCPWAHASPLSMAYHDQEWGRPVRGERQLYERITLEAFQAGLAWITVLRKREHLRHVFADFDPARVAAYDADDVDRLLADPGIIRNRAKVEAAVHNARAVCALDGGLTDLLWAFAPEKRPPPRHLAHVPAVTEESTAMARALKATGFRFVGPTTAYALMQATGMVNDHLDGCLAR